MFESGHIRHRKEELKPLGMVSAARGVFLLVRIFGVGKHIGAIIRTIFGGFLHSVQHDSNDICVPELLAGFLSRITSSKSAA